jgi:Tol biopolymer transport system component
VRRQIALGAVLVALMAGFGLAVYTGLGLVRQVHSSGSTASGEVPIADLRPSVRLPGTLYLAAGGDLLGMRGDTVRAVLTHNGSRRWMQPAVTDDGSVVVVGRGAQSSDLYSAGRDGSGLRRLTDDAASPLRDGSLERDHWAFHPRPGADGRLWYSYDAPKAGFRVDLAVWSLPSLRTPATSAVATRWSSPEQYTGGDVEPLPLPSGGVIFARYAADQGHIVSRLWLQTGPHDPGHPLTAAGDDCSQPDLSPSGNTLAMVCTQGGQATRLEVASFDGGTLGTPRVLASGPLCAFPTWAPDGSGLVYLGPAPNQGGFTLWWLAGAAGATPSSPHQVLDGVSLDATSRPAWAP